jgi:hypothetical protein
LRSRHKSSVDDRRLTLEIDEARDSQGRSLLLFCYTKLV